MSRIKHLLALAHRFTKHHIFLGQWHDAYPDAKILGPEGLPEKRAKQGTENVPFSVVFTAAEPSKTVDEEFDSEFDHEFVHSHANKELVFNFKKDKTLIQADLIFNLPATEQFSKTGQPAETGILTKIFTYINSTRGTGLAQRRFVWYATSSGDRPGFAKSMAKIDKWDFDRIVPCHGDVIESGGKDIFRKIMSWHLQKATV